MIDMRVFGVEEKGDRSHAYNELGASLGAVIVTHTLAHNRGRALLGWEINDRYCYLSFEAVEGIKEMEAGLVGCSTSRA